MGREIDNDRQRDTEGETTMDAPYHKTTIDQDMGEHHTGLRIMRLHDVTTRFEDYSQAAWEDLSADDREWWTATLAEIHEAIVELESLPIEHRGRAKEELTANTSEDLEGHASVIRRAIEETRED
jgi:hypothetical protein